MSAAKVEIYTTPWCPYCIRAKRLLDKKGVDYTEIDVSGSLSARKQMVERAEGRQTVPQIFIDGTGIGGCDELHALEREGRLEDLLAA